MPGIFKKLSANDIKITPFEAHKTYSTADLSSIGASTDFVYWSPYNKAFYTDGNRKYSQINKLYYRDYIRERAHRLELDDATYTTQERRLYEYANVISLSQKTFGSEVQPGTLIISCSYSSSGEQFEINDDSFGNLYDVNRGRDNFPNEDYRILYIGPTQAFKRRDLTIDYETGKEYVNNPFPNGYTRTVYDDSYFLNEVEFNNVNFITSSNSGFYSIKTNSTIGSVTSSIIIPHQPQFNFETDDDFTINFYYDLSSTDIDQCVNNGTYFILTKEGNKTVPILPSETGKHTSLSTTGSAKIGTVPIGGQFPYRIYYKGNTPSANVASIFFERSDGETTQFVSASFFGRTSTGKRFVSCKNDNGVLKIKVDNNDEATSIQQNSPTLNKTVSNKANITLYNKPQPDGSYTNYIGSGSGAISQLMIWNQTLSAAEITNVSESIVGTPNIGNIFYDNGFAVITHPSYKNVLNNYDIATAVSSSTFNNIISNTNHSTTPSDIFITPKGDKMFTIGVDEKLQIYNLTTSHSIENLDTGLGATYNISFSGVSTNPPALTFNNDGTRLFIATYDGASTIYEIPLDTPYTLRPQYGSLESLTDISINNFDAGFEWVQSINFDSSGKKMFLLDSENSKVKRYHLDNPFSLGNVTLDQTIDSNPNGLSSPNDGFDFSEDGYKLFIMHSAVSFNENKISYFELDTPWDLNSAVYITDFILSRTKFNTSIHIHDNGTKISTVAQNEDGSGNFHIVQYNLSQNINKLEYKNTHLITENEYQCTMTEDEFEFTTNTSIRKIPFSDSEDIANFATGSNFKPYVTTVGLYDNSGNLLVVGKLGQPIKASSETDTTFVIRFDT